MESYSIDRRAPPAYQVESAMPTPYDMHCPVARTLDIIGERWTILILRDLLLGDSRRFQDFERSLPGISPNTLSARLKRLEEHGIVERRFYEQHPPRAEYVLTGKGRQLGPVLQTLLDWGSKHTVAPTARSGGR
jgi:DNA-binding HxlR family transcriptional regulator